MMEKVDSVEKSIEKIFREEFDENEVSDLSMGDKNLDLRFT